MCVAGLLPQHIRNLISKETAPLTRTTTLLTPHSVSKDIEAIAVILISYQDALNASSTDKVMALYAPNGVFMPQHSSTSIGYEAVRKAYDRAFSAMTFHVKFNIEEIVPTNADWAFARTTSAGTTTAKSGGGRTGGNQDLFVFQKLDDEWRIARYCYCSTNPPH